jgi:hypothetical protein
MGNKIFVQKEYIGYRTVKSHASNLRLFYYLFQQKQKEQSKKSVTKSGFTAVERNPTRRWQESSFEQTG